MGWLNLLPLSIQHKASVPTTAHRNFSSNIYLLVNNGHSVVTGRLILKFYISSQALFKIKTHISFLTDFYIDQICSQTKFISSFLSILPHPSVYTVYFWVVQASQPWRELDPLEWPFEVCEKEHKLCSRWFLKENQPYFQREPTLFSTVMITAPSSPNLILSHVTKN